MSLTNRLLYRSGNGDCWSLMSDASSGGRFVRHEANPSSGGHLTDTDVEAFLAIRGSGPEFVALREMLGTSPGVSVSALDSGRDEDQANPLEAAALRQEAPAARPMEEEDKVLAGRADANIPALLTKDVKGG
jgi:hypothetical protein